MATKDKAPSEPTPEPVEAAIEAPRPGTKAAMQARITGARFIGGVWLAADGSPLNDAEAQQAHRAMDRAAAAARERALRGAA